MNYFKVSPINEIGQILLMEIKEFLRTDDVVMAEQDGETVSFSLNGNSCVLYNQTNCTRIADNDVITDRDECMAMLSDFYNDCLAFWKNDKWLAFNDDDAKIMALNDVKRCQRNPFVPKGKYIPVNYKWEFIGSVRSAGDSEIVSLQAVNKAIDMGYTAWVDYKSKHYPQID